MQKYNPQNADIQVFIGDRLYLRSEAKVSVFDSTVQGGDAVWEGLRVYEGKVFALDYHIQRMIDSAKAMAFADIPEEKTIKKALFDTLQANGMRDGVHVRMTLSRGEKITSGMDPRLNQSGSCLIILPEWKAPIYESNGIKLITSSVRRNSPSCIDSKIHHNNLINNILAKVEANVAGVDDALMLDLHGFVAETNATNVFMVKNRALHTPLPHACLPGITRRMVMDISLESKIPMFERNISLSEFHSADEVFTTGTMGELSPVLEIDGRKIGEGKAGKLTRVIQECYRKRTEREGEALPFE